ncbi:DUF998 domain-containing protein [Candidatus Woesebacteria bacterium]|nr:DUF998 domain-containing protein [Candidatus Woesebacteria bacterium]
MLNHISRDSLRSSLFFVYSLMVLVIFILPYFSAEGYSIFLHTTSELGAQNTPNSWIMNCIFILLALGTVYGAWIKFRKDILLVFLIFVFSFSLSMTAVFSHAPISMDIQFSQIEDTYHSLFSTLTGFSFTMFAISFGFSQKIKKRRVMAISIAVLASFFSILIFQFPEFAGIWQRFLFLTTFFWLFFFCYN